MNRQDVLYHRLDESALTKLHRRLYGTVIVGHFFDGLDISMVGFVIPGIMKTFRINPSQAGLFASSVFLGMVVGALCVGPLVDRIGRKKGIMLAISTYSIFSLLCAFAMNFSSLFVFRFLEGVGLGAEIPITLTYISEFMPIKYRGGALTLSTCFWTIASVINGILAVILIPYYGWRSMFVVGFIPAIVVLVMILVLPESVRFLVKQGKLEEAEKIVDRVSSIPKGQFPQINASISADIHENRPESARIGEIFKGKYRRMTIGIWFIQFFSGFVLYALSSWLPTLFLKLGMNFVHSMAYSAIITGAGAIGSIFGTFAINKVGYKNLLILFHLLGAVFMVLWLTVHSSMGFTIIIALAMLFGAGAGGVMMAYTSSLYPTATRATGTGWATLCQRVGGIVAPSILGVILGVNFPVYTIFLLLGLAYLINAGLSAWMTYELKGKSLEGIYAELSAQRL